MAAAEGRSPGPAATEALGLPKVPEDGQPCGTAGNDGWLLEALGGNEVEPRRAVRATALDCCGYRSEREGRRG